MPMQPDRFDLAEAMAVLERTPASLRSLLSGLPETWIRATEGDGTWSPYDVIGHLNNAERTNWIVRARHILTGQTGPFPPTFLAGMNLTPADLNRTGLHPEFGEVRLAQLLATWVVHDMTHVAQIVRTMAKAYADAVGPWRAYLSVLQPTVRPK